MGNIRPSHDAFVERERWQLLEIERGVAELDRDRFIAHAEVAAWLRSWGKKRERRVPWPQR